VPVLDRAAWVLSETVFGTGPRSNGLSSLRRGKNPRRWKSRRAGLRALRYKRAFPTRRDFGGADSRYLYPVTCAGP